MQKPSGAFVQSCHRSYTRAQGRCGLTNSRAESGEAGTRLLSARPGAVHTHARTHPPHKPEEEPGPLSLGGRLKEARPWAGALSPAALPTSSATRSPHWMRRSSTS